MQLRASNNHTRTSDCTMYAHAQRQCANEIMDDGITQEDPCTPRDMYSFCLPLCVSLTVFASFLFAVIVHVTCVQRSKTGTL